MIDQPLKSEDLINYGSKKKSNNGKRTLFITLGIMSVILIGCATVYSQQSNGFNGNQMVLSNRKISGFDQKGHYTVVREIEEDKIHKIWLQYSNPGEFYVKEKSVYHENVVMSVERESPTEMTFKMKDEEEEVFQVPHEFPFSYSKDSYEKYKDQSDVYRYEMMKDGRYLRVYRTEGNKEIDIFNSEKNKLIFSKLYTEIYTSIDTPYLWGLGDRRTSNFLLESGIYSIWNRDQSFMDQGKPGGQIYGSHPIWMIQDIKGKFHIVYLRTSNPLQFEYKQGKFIKFKIVGGIVELKFFFGGENPREVIKKYHKYINGWALQPFWSSGWHQSRWGYNSSQELLDVVDNYTKHQIPLDVMWSDIDYMENRRDFTLDTARFKVEDMHKLANRSDPQGVEWVPIIDPGIYWDSDCARKGLEADIFIKSSKKFNKTLNNTNSLLAQVWPGQVYFPDFNHPKSHDVWHDCFMDFNRLYNFQPSGIWIDMNELANFVDGEVDPGTQVQVSTKLGNLQKKASKTKLKTRSETEIEMEDLPFDPSFGKDFNMESHTVSISALHYNKEDALYFRTKKGNLTELSVHTMYGMLESIATKESQRKIHNTNLTFVLTRSTFAGSGRFSQHWLGDNQASWEWLSSSIPAIFSFNLFGIPFIGDDVCGFNLNTTAQLCTRWQQLAAFYPFARSHVSINSIPHEPYRFDEYLIESTRKSLNLRYSLLKFYYTEFAKQYDREINAGVGTFFNPLFYLYPNDKNTLDIDDQLIIGDSLIVIPIVNQQKSQRTQETSQKFYVPKSAVWFEWFGGKSYVGPQKNVATISFNDTSLVFINEGRTIPVSNTTGVLRLRYLPQNIGLAIALQSFQDQQSYKYISQGTYLSLDSYEPINVEERCWNPYSSCHRELQVTGVSNGKTLELTITNAPGGPLDNSQEIFIDYLYIYGVKKEHDFIDRIIETKVNFSSLETIWSVSIEI